MSNEIIGILLTFFLGIFILIGGLIVFFIKKSNNFIKYSIGMAFGVMVMLVIFDLVPEVFSTFHTKNSTLITILIISGLILLGIGLLKLFDLFIPDHHDDKKDESKNLYHIGIVSSIALVLHNIIEGMAIYNVFTNSLRMGILLSIGIGLHNIPLGMIITSTFYNGKSKKNTLLIVLCISLSTFLGGLIMFLLNNIISEVVIGCLLGITIGMIIYIALFELLPHILEDKNKKYSYLGILSGILIIVISLFFHSH